MLQPQTVRSRARTIAARVALLQRKGRGARIVYYLVSANIAGVAAVHPVVPSRVTWASGRFGGSTLHTCSHACMGRQECAHACGRAGGSVTSVCCRCPVGTVTEVRC